MCLQKLSIRDNHVPASLEFGNKYAFESVCIEETIYWTELANQTQNTIYYVVSNIHLA